VSLTQLVEILYILYRIYIGTGVQISDTLFIHFKDEILTTRVPEKKYINIYI
jgi:hypothetical protein